MKERKNERENEAKVEVHMPSAETLVFPKRSARGDAGTSREGKERCSLVCGLDSQ